MFDTTASAAGMMLAIVVLGAAYLLATNRLHRTAAVLGIMALLIAGASIISS